MRHTPSWAERKLRGGSAEVAPNWHNLAKIRARFDRELEYLSNCKLSQIDELVGDGLKWQKIKADNVEKMMGEGTSPRINCR